MKIKKAMAMSTTIMLILVVIGSIILLSYGYLVAKELKKGTDIEACRISVIKASELKAGGKALVALDCPRENITITMKDIEEAGEISENKIKRIFAEEMRKCWHKLGRGANVPFNQNFLFGQKRACLVCSEIYFDDELAYELRNKEVTEFTKFLNTTRMNGEHYYDYFTRELYATERAIPFIARRVARGEESALEGIDSISAQKDYYVVYEVYSPTAVHNSFLDDFKSWVGAKKSLEALGALVVVESDDFPLLKCDILYN